jgi:hypothetical protein
LKLTWEFSPSNIVTCVFPFIQFANKGLDRFFKNISKKLHDHFFSNIIFNMVRKPPSLWFTLCMFEALCGLKSKCLTFCWPNHSTFSPTLWYFLLHFVHQVGFLGWPIAFAAYPWII